MDYLLKLLSHLLRLTPTLDYYGTKTRVKFTGSCLKQPNISYTHRTIVDIYIVYELDASSFHNNVPTLKKDILVLGKGPTQGLEHTLTAEKIYSINFTVTKIKFSLSLLYNGANSNLLVNGTKIYKFKAKDFKTVEASLCLRNISKD